MTPRSVPIVRAGTIHSERGQRACSLAGLAGGENWQRYETAKTPQLLPLRSAADLVK